MSEHQRPDALRALRTPGVTDAPAGARAPLTAFRTPAHEDRDDDELGDASKEGNREVEDEEHEVRDARNRSDGNVERD